MLSHHVGNCVGPRDRLSVGAGLVEKQASGSSHTLKLSRHSRPNGWTRLRPDSNVGDQTLLDNHPLHFTPSSGEWGWRRGSAKGETAWFEDKNFSHSTIYPSLSPSRVWKAGVVLTVLWALHRPRLSGLCSQGHWKVGKGEESSWEMTEAGYLEATPGSVDGSDPFWVSFQIGRASCRERV